jgi:hypothetical protein
MVGGVESGGACASGGGLERDGVVFDDADGVEWVMAKAVGVA